MEKLVGWDALRATYAGKKVFLTGHTGFKGAWLLLCLQALGAEVRGYSLAPDYPDGLYDFLPPLPAGNSSIADICDRNRLTTALLSCNPDFIFHLAAQPLVRRSYQMPAETFEVNVSGTANLLEAAAALPGSCTIVVVTTDKVYENKEQDLLYAEDDVLGGYDPYSASKACTEIVISSFRNSFFHPAKHAVHGKGLASARAGNVIGGGDWSEDRIIPDIVRHLARRQSIVVRNPAAIRPWQHVLEPLAGYLTLGHLLHHQPTAFAKAYNFGPQPQDHLTVRELVETAVGCWGSGEWTDASDPSQPHEAGILKLDIRRAKAELGWQPRLSAKDAIRWTIDWYLQPDRDKLAFTQRQLNEYFQA